MAIGFGSQPHRGALVVAALRFALAAREHKRAWTAKREG